MEAYFLENIDESKSKFDHLILSCLTRRVKDNSFMEWVWKKLMVTGKHACYNVSCEKFQSEMY